MCPVRSIYLTLKHSCIALSVPRYCEIKITYINVDKVTCHTRRFCGHFVTIFVYQIAQLYECVLFISV